MYDESIMSLTIDYMVLLVMYNQRLGVYMDITIVH